MQFNSQGGQDEWVCNMLNNKRNGYFIDIGATDGESLSNTYVLEKELGWLGLCFEPARRQFKKLKRIRDCLCINKAVFNNDGIVGFMEYTEDKYRGNITDIKFDNTGFQYDIESISFDSLLRKYKCPKVIDYISLDVEGLEYDILCGFPFEEYISKLWTIEYNDNRDKIRELMISKEYSIVPDHIKKADWEDWFYYG